MTIVPTEHLDVVCPYKYVGEGEELRYALRSLALNFPHATLWLVGAKPPWADTDTLGFLPNAAPNDRHQATTSHLEAAVRSDEISDPFVLINDDFFCLRPMDGLELLHRGPLGNVARHFRNLRSRWGERLRITEAHLERSFPDRELFSYDLHVPILVHKEPMAETLELARRRRIHKRTVYGNIAQLGGREIRDPKFTSAPQELPGDGWMSSEERSFPTAVQPILRNMFPDLGVYERVGPKPSKTIIDRGASQRKRRLNHQDVQESRVARARARVLAREQQAVPR